MTQTGKTVTRRKIYQGLKMKTLADLHCKVSFDTGNVLFCISCKSIAGIRALGSNPDCWNCQERASL